MYLPRLYQRNAFVEGITLIRLYFVTGNKAAPRCRPTDGRPGLFIGTVSHPWHLLTRVTSSHIHPSSTRPYKFTEFNLADTRSDKIKRADSNIKSTVMP